MQFFYLFSFVVAASYAAALPQPAGLSEKYSNNVDNNLASGLEARSYQPGLNSYKESATSTLLKRRGDSLESPGEDSGSDSSPPPDTTPTKPFSDPFTEDAVSSENLSSTIDNVGDGVVDLFEEGELAIQKIDGPVGDMVAKYLRRNTYVDLALRRWAYESADGILEFLKLGYSDDIYPNVLSHLTETIKKWEDKSHAGMNAMIDATLKIVKGDGSVTENLHNVRESFKTIFEGRWHILFELRTRLGKFEAGKTLERHLNDADASFAKFSQEQHKFYDEIMEKLKAAPSQE
ncbi:hypothetical protein BASA50_000542 [Batrachochytrium salamandrivorans]|uniref:RxLR effector protein n=1 Tax=Batrachochytrium salamandrivorans TaxID=1357716 RepID=A0ABQ8ETJ7_9FUNG|nr:hypothetical protein BASA50_000542 [Batrachochytrium salamandrivorans]KAH9250167.1 hypothetical protein BASA81_012045 [Batrachochytrium salamandrivorans]KAH9268043.1 hypothetical protein BASA83_009548 [Batrachochytrium salamandrivorans]